MANGKVTRWRKILYEENGFPDNYTPKESFLAAIERNKNIKLYTKWECFQGAAVVGKEVSLVIIFWCCYCSLLGQELDPERLLILMAISLLIWQMLSLRMSTIISALRTTLQFSVIGWALSPVLYNLTSSISTDTLHTTAGLALCLHLLTADYGITGPLVSRPIALNSAVFSSVCLASRLSSHTAAFSLLGFAIFLFLLLPMVPAFESSSLISSAMFLIAAMLWLSVIDVPFPIFVLLCSIQTLLQVLCPLLYYHLQFSKQTIHGPWDEAVPF